jgi:hypothetical protein
VIFLKKNHHAVRKLHTARLLGVKGVQGWSFDLFPIGRLGSRSRSEGQRAEE